MGGKRSGRPKGALLRLDGIQQSESGKLSRTDFFNFLEMDLTDYGDLGLSSEQALKFRNHVIRMKYGVSAAIPMLCPGYKCPNKTCIFHEVGRYPLTKPCLVETRMIQELTMSYMEDIGVDPDNITEMVLVSKLVECDLLDYRANLGLSGNRDEEAVSLLKTNLVDNGKSTTETTVIHPLLEVKEKIHRQRTSILESLAVTRREKYKKASALKQSEDTDASNYLSELRKLYSKAKDSSRNSFERIKEDAKKVELDTSYIDTDWSTDE